MSLTVTGTVTPSTPNNGVVTLTFTDTTTGVTGLVSRTLVITNPNNVILATINMGATLVATYPITSDQYLIFTETIVDNSGTSVGTVKYLSVVFYEYLFPQLVAAITSDCDTFGQIYNLSRAELYKDAAVDMGTFSQAVASNALIIQANFYLQTPYYS